jgi:glycosyltransferase involved in cell wall biosynthesis
MLRAVFVIGSLQHGGAERHAVSLMNRLAERGHECHAVAIKPDDPRLAERLRLRNGGTTRCLDAQHYFDRRALARFAAHLSAIKPSVVVAANPYALMYAWIALRLSRIPAALVVTYHSNRLLGAKEWLQMMIYRLFFWTSDCLVFVCERQKRYWSRRAVLARRTEVIHNGVDTEEFAERRDAGERRTLRRALGFRDADYVIGLPAVLRPEKNPVQLVDAVAALRTLGIPARALLIGDGEMRGAVEARARALGIERHVVVSGLQRDVRAHVAACDAVVLCSLTEALSMAAIEAMALGRPVVHSDVGGAAEMIEPGRNGFLFPVGDTRALVGKLAILANRGDCERMGRAARATAEARFSEKRMVDRYEQVLLDLAQSDRTMPGERLLHIR